MGMALCGSVLVFRSCTGDEIVLQQMWIQHIRHGGLTAVGREVPPRSGGWALDTGHRFCAWARPVPGGEADCPSADLASLVVSLFPICALLLTSQEGT